MVKQAYPLSVLFIAVAVAAALMAMLVPLGKQIPALDAQDVIQAVILCTLMGGFVGFVVGMHRHRRLASSAIGSVFGGFVGMFIGPLTLVNETGIGTTFAIQLGSALALLVIATVLWTGQPDPLWNSVSSQDSAPSVAAMEEDNADRSAGD